jgi:hypothetical protein
MVSILEIEIKNELERYFKIKLLFTKEYDIYDYVNEHKNIFFELKGRSNNYSKYPTTMIGYNKVLECIKNKNNKYYFVFKFTDGLYYCKYSKKLLKKCTIKKGGRTDRGRPEIKEYLFIPIELLKKI